MRGISAAAGTVNQTCDFIGSHLDGPSTDCNMSLKNWLRKK